MNDTNKRRKERERGQSIPAPPIKSDHPVEKDDAVERGERIHTGKIIARGGKRAGHVPGATEQKK